MASLQITAAVKAQAADAINSATHVLQTIRDRLTGRFNYKIEKCFICIVGVRNVSEAIEYLKEDAI